MSDPSLRFDLEQIVNGRGGKGRVPQFVINWGKRFIHQDFINGFLEQGYEGVEFCEECMKALDVTVNVEGMENLEGFGDDVRFTDSEAQSTTFIMPQRNDALNMFRDSIDISAAPQFSIACRVSSLICASTA